MSFGTGINYKISLFGTSHGDCVGVAVEGVKAGCVIDLSEIRRELLRRRSDNALSTERREKDDFKIISGFFDNKTNGAPIVCVFENNDVRSGDYDRFVPRPGHSDYPAYIKYQGNNDYRGGGFFSGRMTAPLVFAGAVAKQILAKRNIYIYSHIQKVMAEWECSFSDRENWNDDILNKLSQSSFPCIEKEKTFLSIIDKHKDDSVGGVCEVMALGVPVGAGEPFFDSVESVLSKLYFSVPGIKGVEFGEGFRHSEMTGSEANDQIENENGVIKFLSNHSGGVNGGLANGMPIVARVAVRPTPTVRKEMKTVHLKTEENLVKSFGGRHDRSILLRVAPVIESVTAIGLLDLIKL